MTVVVEEYLLDPKRFWLAVPPPSVPPTEPSFSTRDDHFMWIRRYWRGPTWVNSAWLVWLGLVRLGYAAEAGADFTVVRALPCDVPLGDRRPARLGRPQG